MMRLFLVRHGITAWNDHGIYQGQTDVPLSDEGRRQVGALRDRLRDQEFAACFTSLLSRAGESARIVVGARSCPVYETAELNEMSYGKWEGLNQQQIRERFPLDWSRFMTDRVASAPSGGESQRDLAGRVQRVLARIESEYLQTGATILVAAHGGSVREIVAHYLGLGEENARRLRLDNASLSIIEVYGDDAIVSLFNDTAHLSASKDPPQRQPAH